MTFFANKTGSRIKKHVGGSTWGDVGPIVEGYDPHASVSGRNPREWVVHPPRTSPSVFLILLPSTMVFIRYEVTLAQYVVQNNSISSDNNEEVLNSSCSEGLPIARETSA